jgi:1,4-dihydroxy-2-naphthoate octaprenyltransferase
MNQVKTSKLESWILASRPKTLLAAVVPVMVGSALAISQNHFTFIYSLVALLCSVLIQIGTNFTNDLYDYLKGADNKNRKGPERVLSSGLITPTEMKIAIAIVFGLAFLLGLYLVYSVDLVILVIGVLSILAGLAYTAGPYPLAYNGLGDIFVFAFFGIVGTMGTYYLHLQEFTVLSFLISLPVGALITNILVINNYRDIDEDREAIKGTQLNKTLELSAKYAALFGLLFSVGIIL